jgi:hypothetical protein
MALKDLQPGEQLFEDYLHFEYDETKIIGCECGSKRCRGRISGFKNLPLIEKLRRVNLCDPSLVDKWLRDDATVKGIALQLGDADIAQVFQMDDVGRQILPESVLLSEADRRPTAAKPTIIAKVGGRHYWCTPAICDRLAALKVDLFE